MLLSGANYNNYNSRMSSNSQITDVARHQNEECQGNINSTQYSSQLVWSRMQAILGFSNHLDIQQNPIVEKTLWNPYLSPCFQFLFSPPFKVMFSSFPQKAMWPELCVPPHQNPTWNIVSLVIEQKGTKWLNYKLGARGPLPSWW